MASTSPAGAGGGDAVGAALGGELGVLTALGLGSGEGRRPDAGRCVGCIIWGTAMNSATAGSSRAVPRPHSLEVSLVRATSQLARIGG